VHAGQSAPIGVHGEFAAWRDAPAKHEPRALALRAKAEVFEKKNGVDGEGVVEFHYVDISR